MLPPVAMIGVPTGWVVETPPLDRTPVPLGSPMPGSEPGTGRLAPPPGSTVCVAGCWPEDSMACMAAGSIGGGPDGAVVPGLTTPLLLQLAAPNGCCGCCPCGRAPTGGGGIAPLDVG